MEQTNFPWAYPELFTNILLMTDFKTILDTRLTCTSFRDWFNKNKIWKRYLDQNKQVFVKEYINNMERRETSKSYITDYRLNRLLKGSITCLNKLTEREALKISCKIYKILRQHELDLVPIIPKATYFTCKLLEQKANEEDGIKTFGPISVFIRIKVKSPVVASIVAEVINTIEHLSDYGVLSCIVVDRYERETNPTVQDIALNVSYLSRHRECEFLYTYFNKEQDQSMKECEDYLKAIWKERIAWQRDDAIDEYNAKKESQSSIAEDRNDKESQSSKADDRNDWERGDAINEYKSEKDNRKNWESLADIEKHYKRQLEDIYDCLDCNNGNIKKAKGDKGNKEEPSLYNEDEPTPINPNFPTVLELIDFDNPIVERALIERGKIDKILIVPNLELAFLQQSNLNHIVPEEFEVFGRDSDGQIKKFIPCIDVRETELSTVINLRDIGPVHKEPPEKIMFWGGSDIVNRWSVCAEQLSLEETQPMEIQRQVWDSDYQTPPELEKDIPESLPEIEAMLEARGTFIERI